MNTTTPEQETRSTPTWFGSCWLRTTTAQTLRTPPVIAMLQQLLATLRDPRSPSARRTPACAARSRYCASWTPRPAPDAPGKTQTARATARTFRRWMRSPARPSPPGSPPNGCTDYPTPPSAPNLSSRSSKNYWRSCWTNSHQYTTSRSASTEQCACSASSSLITSTATHTPTSNHPPHPPQPAAPPGSPHRTTPAGTAGSNHPTPARAVAGTRAHRLSLNAKGGEPLMRTTATTTTFIHSGGTWPHARRRTRHLVARQ